MFKEKNVPSSSSSFKWTTKLRNFFDKKNGFGFFFEKNYFVCVPTQKKHFNL